MISDLMEWNAKSMGFSLAGLTIMIYKLTSIRVAAVCHTKNSQESSKTFSQTAAWIANVELYT